jgi:hypothetical protein
MHLSHRLLRLGLLSAGLLGLPGAARAGMPTVSLTDVARMRFEAISFFLVVFLLCALGVYLLWNYLRKDFASLPRLSYGKALGLVSLWGLLFVLVLTMISGARELMTPGAWKKEGRTYRLADQEAEPEPPDPKVAARREKLEALRFALWEYARTHSGQFPSSPDVPEIPAGRWRLPDASGMRYVYAGGFVNGKDAPLAFEPEVFGDKRFVLFTSGEVRLLTSAELNRALQARRPQ